MFVATRACVDMTLCRNVCEHVARMTGMNVMHEVNVKYGNYCTGYVKYGNYYCTRDLNVTQTHTRKRTPSETEGSEKQGPRVIQ